MHRPSQRFPRRKLPASLLVAAALLAGFCLRFWFITHAARIAGDTLVYGEIAKNWMQHGVYGFVKIAGVPQPTLIRLPGYPLFLAACFGIFGVDHYVAVLYVQAAIDLLSCLLLASLAGRLWGPRARLAALWLAVLCPFTASYVAAALSETLTLACIVIAFYALERWITARWITARWLTAASEPQLPDPPKTTSSRPEHRGVEGSPHFSTRPQINRPRAIGSPWNRWLWIIVLALAYSILLRPEQGLLAAAILPAMLTLSLHPATSARVPHPFALLRKGGMFATRRFLTHPLRAALPILTAALCILLPLVPWTIRNERTFHVFQALAPRYANDPGEKISPGFDRWYRTWAIDFSSTEDVYWNYDGGPIPLADLPARAFDDADQYTRTAALLDDYNDTSNATPALDTRFDALARERIAAHPLRYSIALPTARLLNMALRPRTEMLETPLEWWKWHEHPAPTAFAAAYAALNLAYLALAALGIARWSRRPPNRHAPLAWALLASILLRSALLLTLDNSEPRYTLEFFPIIFLFASLVLTSPQRATRNPPPPSS